MSTLETGAGSLRRAADGPDWRLRPGWRKAVLFVHITSSVALVGEVWGLVVLNLTATLTDDHQLALSAYRLMEALVFSGGAPLSLVALASGVTLGMTSRWGVLRHWWVLTKLVLLVATVAAGIALFDPRALAAGAPDLPAPAQQWQAVVVTGAQLAMLLTAVAVAVWRPGGRISRRAGRG